MSVYLKRIAKLSRILTVPSFLRALLKGVAAGTEHMKVLQNLKCNFVVDIGANRGQFALAARQSFPQAKIISFEPLKEPAEVFRSVLGADVRVTLHECAVGPAELEMPIHISQSDDSSSLLPIAPLQNQLFPGTAEKEIRKVVMKPLQAVLRAEEIEGPAILKLDVQGFEKQALDGCSSLLGSFSYVYVECSFLELYQGQSLAHEVIAYLEGHEFILCGIYNLMYDEHGLAIQGDFLFRNRKL